MIELNCKTLNDIKICQNIKGMSVHTHTTGQLYWKDQFIKHAVFGQLMSLVCHANVIRCQSQYWMPNVNISNAAQQLHVGESVSTADLFCVIYVSVALFSGSMLIYSYSKKATSSFSLSYFFFFQPVNNVTQLMLGQAWLVDKTKFGNGMGGLCPV